MVYHLGIVGCGTAGLFASYFYARRHAGPCVIIDANPTLGLSRTRMADGQGLVGHHASTAEFVNSVYDNGSFLVPSLKAFSADTLQNTLFGSGIETVRDETGRIFLASRAAQTVIHTFTNLLRRQKSIDIHTQTRAENITYDKTKQLFTIISGRRRFMCRNLLLAGGGGLHPEFGADDRLFQLTRQLGHRIAPPRPVHVPLIIQDGWLRALKGTTLPQAVLAYHAHRKRYYTRGNLTVLADGLGGPAALNMSRYIAASNEYYPVDVTVNFTPFEVGAEFHRILRREVSASPRKTMFSLLKNHLPVPFLGHMNDGFSLDLQTKSADYSPYHRRVLVNTLANQELTVMSLKESEAPWCYGGVDTRQIRKQSLMSKIVPGLFFAGEMIDVDAMWGGYNTHIAIATAHQAVNHLLP